MSARGLTRLGRRTRVVRSKILLQCVHVFSRLAGRLGCTARGEILLRMALVGLYGPRVRDAGSDLLSQVHTLRGRMRRKDFTITRPRREIICMGNRTPGPRPGPRLPGTLGRSMGRIASGFQGVTGRTSKVLENCLGRTELDISGRSELLVILPSRVDTDIMKDRRRGRRLGSLVRGGVNGAIRVSIHRIRGKHRFRSDFISVRGIVGVRVAVRSRWWLKKFVIVTGEKKFPKNKVPKGVTGLVGRTRGVRGRVRRRTGRVRRGDFATATNNKTMRIAMDNGGRIRGMGLRRRIISPSSMRVLRSLVVTTIGRTLHRISRTGASTVDGLANKLNKVPKVF